LAKISDAAKRDENYAKLAALIVSGNAVEKEDA
jgi:hypothetical protein